MIRPPLDSNPIGTNTPNARISNLDLTPVGTKTPYPKQLTLSMELSKRKEKHKKNTHQMIQSQTHRCQTHHRASDWSNDSKYRKSKSKGRDKKNKYNKRKKQDSTDLSSSVSDSSDEIDLKARDTIKK